MTGVGFFDVIHGQTGVAPNGIELHPVVSFSGSCGSGSPSVTTTVTATSTPTKFVAPTPTPTSPSGVRTGAVCNDGTTSSATGSGACSHQGGVANWTYS